MIIQSRLKQYSVHLQDTYEFIHDIEKEENTFWVLDQNVYNIYKTEVFSNLPEKNIYLLDAVEEKKTMSSVLEICERMTVLSAKRNIHLISVGGGITQDITGLVANLLYRGIRWTFVPTTLLAACDSCIGGKTSLNYKAYKNLLGTFYPPDCIYIVPAFFDTLSSRDYESGLGEVVKFNIMYGEEGLERISEDMESLLNRNRKTVKKYVEQSLMFKKSYIEQDEFDCGMRIMLNFAHTFGHAIEKVSEYEIPHGTAVAMGTVVANEISRKRGMLSDETAKRIESLMRQIIHVTYEFKESSVERLLCAISKDKKQIGDNIRAVLFVDGLKLGIFDDLSKAEIVHAFNHLFAYLRKGV